MFMQTCSMKKTMKAYPEFLGIDGTYKLLNIGIPVFLIVVEDGNCQTEIVCLCLLTTEVKLVSNGSWKLSEITTLKVNVQNAL
nr:unnamed protein product [Callosobruchus chinensis]CAH7736672.1 unnamed protein product [Callosobruchus chinensis]CAH7748879.1 unnamed protein product [Callosobruchus chinensis]